MASSRETDRPPTRQDLVRKLFDGGQPVQELRVDWRQNVGGRLLSAPGVGPDGTLAFVNDDHCVLLRPDGSQMITVKQGQPHWFNGFLPPVVHNDGVVLAGSTGVTSLGSDGEPRWHKDIGEMRTRPVVAPDGSVFAAGGDCIHAFSPSGQKLWSTSLRQELVDLYREDREQWAESLRKDLDNPDKADRRQVLESLLADAEKQLADPEFGKDLQVNIRGGPSLGPDGKLYCFTEVGPLFCLDRESGEIQWVNPDTRNYLAEGGVNFTPEGDLLGVTGNSLLRVFSPQGEVRFDYGCWLEKRLDQATPEQEDDARRSGNMGSCGLPVLSPDASTIYWGGRDGSVRAVDRQGNKVWTVQIPHDRGYAGEMSVSVGADGTLYCANSKGLNALSPQGEELWRYETSDKYAFAALCGDKIILSTYQGNVYALDCGGLKARAEAALEGQEAAPRIAIADGYVTIGGVRVKQRARPQAS